MNLLIDIGNTRIKWGIENEGRISAEKPIPHEDLFATRRLHGIWKEIHRPDCVALSSVAGSAKTKDVIGAVFTLWPEIKLVVAKSQNEAHGVKNGYACPEKLGVDRWMALLAVRKHYRLPAVVVDCGTAITLDILDENGTHRGGLIIPGLQLMKRALNQGTHLLEINERNYFVGIADCTEAAIHSGILYSISGMIERSLLSFKHESAEEISLVLTGGDAEHVSAQLTSNCSVDSFLVLKGLSVYLED
ncbi:MAG: type III pantothenate kinase [Gammaproteobacteria bacterium]